MPKVQEYIAALKCCLEELSASNLDDIAGEIFTAYRNRRHIFIMGNGGSAATASHLARDLKIGAAVEGKPRVQAISLADSVAAITSIANDADFGVIFQEQLMGQLREGDIVIVISASGNSPNVVRAAQYARQQGAIVIGFLGFGGGQMRELAHRSIALSSRDYGQVEDVHLAVCHMVSYLVKDRIAEAPPPPF